MRELAVWTLIGIAIAVAVVDGYLILHGGPDAALSGRIRQIGRAYPVVPFAAGCLVAHLFGF